MTSTDTKTEPYGMPWQKRVADVCTASRGPLGVVLVWLGITRGKDAVLLAFILLLIAATVDTMDGYFARISNAPHQTWIGAHDLVFDLGFSAALLLYLALAEYFSPVLALGYAGFWMVVFNQQTTISNTLAVLSQGPIYAGAALAAISAHTPVILWLIVWISVMLLFAGRRFFHTRLPAFLTDLSRRIAERWQNLSTRNR